MSRVYTADSPIHGTGVFSSAPFSPGEIVLRIDDSRVVTDADPLDPARGEFEHHCDYLAGGKVVLMQPPERFINHSLRPEHLHQDDRRGPLRRRPPGHPPRRGDHVRLLRQRRRRHRLGLLLRQPGLPQTAPLRLLPPARGRPGPLPGPARRLVRRRAP